jgi:hypothetical protein
MQEGAQVGWDPISINYQPPWASKLLILYLLMVVTISVVKSASVLRILWYSRRGSLLSPSSDDEFLLAWETCSNKIQSIKNLVYITLLWTVLVAVLLLRSTFMRLVEQKVFGPAVFSGNIAEVLTVLAIGIIVSAVLYAACSFYEGVLLHRKNITELCSCTYGGLPA